MKQRDDTFDCEGGVWPLQNTIVLAKDNSASVANSGNDSPARNDHRPATGKKTVQVYFANDGRFRYGPIMLDAARPRAGVIEPIAKRRRVFEKRLLWGELWDSVREAE